MNGLRRTQRLLVVALFLAMGVIRVLAAGPKAIMLFGGSLKERVYLTDWQENLKFTMALKPAVVRDADLNGRAFLEFTMFSAPQWDKAMAGGRKIADVRPDEGTPRGRFYPATASGPALLVEMYPSPNGWTVSQAGLEILSRSGLPVGALTTVAR
jgi:hypothetical protein